MTSLFCVSYFWPPDPCTRAIQAFKTIRALCNQGARVRLVAANTGVPGAVSEMDLFQPTGMVTQLLPPSENRILDYFFRVPDGNFGWKKTVESWLRTHADFIKESDAIFTIAQPFTCHLVGREIKQKTGKPWVAYFSDPWSDNPYLRLQFLTKPLNRFLEKRVIEEADALIFATEATRKLVMSKYDPATLEKAHVIPHAFTPELYPQSHHSSRGDKTHLVHLGNLYGLRSPEPLFEALANLARESPSIAEKLEFVQVGNIIPQFRKLIEKHGVGNFVRIEPQVSYLRSLERMIAADVLVLIEADLQESVFLPSKLVDYIGAERPIFGITPLHGESATLIGRLGGLLAAPSSISEIANCLIQIVKDRERNRDSACCKEIVQEYRDDVVCAKYADVFASVINRNKR